MRGPHLVDKLAGGIALAATDGQEEMLGRYVLVLEALGLFVRLLEDLVQRRRHVRAALGAGDLRDRAELATRFLSHRAGLDAYLREHGLYDSLGLLDQRDQ